MKHLLPTLLLLLAGLLPAAPLPAQTLTDTDTDNDGIPDAQDNCPEVFNPTQETPVYYADIDEDGYGDAGDRFVGCTPPVGKVYVRNNADNCPGAYNPTQTDEDWDGIGDLCDPG